MPLTVVVRSGDVSSPPSVTFDAPRIVIGRGDGCEVRLPDPSVSHRHASIRVEGTNYVLYDESSTNGTFANGARLEKGAPHVLESGTLVRVGRVWLEIKIEQTIATANPAVATKEIALALVSEALAAQGDDVAARVRIVAGPDEGLELQVSSTTKRYIVGRNKGANLSVQDEDASRRHVEIFRQGDQLFVRDLASKNGSRLGDQPLKPEAETAWPSGTRLYVGANELDYDDPVVEALEELERAADEHIPKGEDIAPPVGVAAPKTSEGSAEPAAPSPARGAPIAKVPKAAPRAPSRGSWGPTDVLVALLALVVLGISLLGLWWLFRS